MRNLIVNADDFGISPGVNRGIIESFEKGIVRSTSLMANMPAASAAAQAAKQHPGLGVGVHLNLTCGRPLCSPQSVPTLVQKDGSFFALSTLVKRLMFGKVAQTDVEMEFQAQIKKTISLGLVPSHLDSHQHIHFYPVLQKIVLKLAHEYKIAWIRGASSSLLRGLFLRPSKAIDGSVYKSVMKASVLSFLRRFGNSTGHGIKKADTMLGLADVPQGYYQQALEKYFRSMKDGVNELVCHPGYVDDELKKQDNWFSMREEEMKALTALETKSAFQNTGNVLTNFKAADL